MKKHFPRIVKITLISVYLIFLAGAIVRMTGSGMGCPDWPKCFGYYIPPTSEEQITWQPNKEFKKGMIIVKDEALFVAESDLKTSSEFNSNNWKKDKKHDYAKFNKYHTWTEYINRLASVVSGFVFLFFVYVAAKFWKENKTIPLLAFGAFFLMLFEAWLGKTVVDTNLKPTVITIHMVVGLIIVALLLWLLFIVSERPFDYAQGDKPKYNSVFNKLLIVSVVFSLIQIAMGTQVRQFIDEQVKDHLPLLLY
jgi:cytochrome c oxidase assembly protein subunit 15